MQVNRLALIATITGIALLQACLAEAGSALHNAVSRGDMATIHRLLSAGADVNVVSKTGYTPLHGAAESGHERVIEVLLKHGARVTADIYGMAPQHYAAEQGHESVFRRLCSCKADRDAQFLSLCWTPLHCAVSAGRMQMVQGLLDCEANTEAVDFNGLTPLHHAVKSGNRREIVRLLVDRGANVEAKTEEGYTALSLACRGGHKAVMGLLLECGADPNDIDKHKLSLLHWVIDAPRNRVKCIALLLMYGADADAIDGRGWAPLHHVLRRYNYSQKNSNDDWSVARCLVNRGADVDALDKSGRMPLSLCEVDELHDQLEQLAEGRLKAVESLAMHVQEHASWPTDSNNSVKRCILEMALSAKQRERLRRMRIIMSHSAVT